MLANQAQQATRLGGIAAISAAATVNATSGWIDIREIEGDLLANVNIGAVTAGDIVPAFEDADDDSGTNAAAITPIGGALTTVTTANDPLAQKAVFNTNAIRGYVRFVGTITTGPALVAVDFYGSRKNP